MIFFSKGCKDEKELSSILDIPSGRLPVKYLGLPLTIQFPKAKHFSPLVDKLRAKIEGWTTHNLSFTGRLELIKSTLYSTMAYWYQYYSYPSSITKEIERICANFLWKGRLHTMSCADLCRPKTEVGLASEECRICVMQ